MTNEHEDLFRHPVVEQNGDSFGHRVTREDREDDVVEVPLGQLVRPGGDQGDDGDGEGDEVAFALSEADQTLHDYPGEYDEVVPAEVAAMHLTDPPPMGDGHGYVDD